jgi:antirestriction factor ArdC-like protein/zincin-like metallopeptidase
MYRKTSSHERPKGDLYADVTNQIIAAIESGEATYSLPWQHVPGMPKNVASNRSYRGINTLLLWLIGNSKGYTTPYWATFKQWHEIGHSVRKGEKSATVVFWKQLAERGAEPAETASEGDTGDNRRPILARAYHVFNAAQVDGFTLPNITPLSEGQRDANAEAFFGKLPIEVRHEGNQAFYRPSTDSVHLPEFGLFKDANAYYAIFEVRGEFLSARRPYQYGFLNAYMKLWKAPAPAAPQFDWSKGWPDLIDWMLKLLEQRQFWDEDLEKGEVLTPTRDWIPPIVADFLRAGMSDDARAFEPALLPQAKKLIELLLRHLPSEAVRPDSEPMIFAINTSRGKAIETLVSFALRLARVTDRNDNTHEVAWRDVLQPMFDREVQRISSGNPEFVVLFGQFAAHFQYLSADWTAANFTKVVDPKSVESLRLALSGMAYAPATKQLYALLSDTGTIDAGLVLRELRREAREKLLERITVAYLAGDEPLTGRRMGRLLEPIQVEDLDAIAGFLWQVNGQALEPQQIELTRQFWRTATKKAQSVNPAPDRLLATLSRLLCYLDKLDSNDRDLVILLAAHADAGHSGWFFLKELNRLVETNPSLAASAFLTYVETFRPFFDYEGILLSTTEKIIQSGEKEAAIKVTEALKGLPEFRELYSRIR